MFSVAPSRSPAASWLNGPRRPPPSGNCLSSSRAPNFHSETRFGGRPAMHPRRRIVDAIMYLHHTGCSWRQLPHEFPPCETV
ncbi:transposase [Mycobacterium decipiens]